MSFEKLVENKIREAMAKGEFDNLPGQGRPLDLTEYFNTPAELRLGYALLKSAGHVPAEVELRRELETLRAQLAAGADDSERARLSQEIKNKVLKLNLLTDSNRPKQGARG